MKSHTLRNVFHLVVCGLILQVGLHTANGQSTLAQERIPVDLKNFQLNLNILEPGLSFEQKVNDNQSFTVAAGVTMFTVVDEDYDTQDEFLYSFNPYITGSFQHYYNRKWVRKKLKPNSGNFLGLSAGYYFDAIADNLDYGTTERSKSFTIGPVWGIQRNYQSGIHLKLSLGPGIGFGENAESDVFFTPAGGFEFGFVIK